MGNQIKQTQHYNPIHQPTTMKALMQAIPNAMSKNDEEDYSNNPDHLLRDYVKRSDEWLSQISQSTLASREEAESISFECALLLISANKNLEACREILENLQELKDAPLRLRFIHFVQRTKEEEKFHKNRWAALKADIKRASRLRAAATGFLQIPKKKERQERKLRRLYAKFAKNTHNKYGKMGKLLKSKAVKAC